MIFMFLGTKKFNQDISKWNVSNVKYMDDMFYSKYLFYQDILQWFLKKLLNIILLIEICILFLFSIS